MALARWERALPDVRQQQGEVAEKSEALAVLHTPSEAAVLRKGWHDHGRFAAIRTVYPRVRHQRCWVHKMRNILEKARKLRLRPSQSRSAGHLSSGEPSAGRSRVSSLPRPLAWPLSWRSAATGKTCPKCCHSSLFPRQGRKLRTTNVIERCFVEVRRRTRSHGLLRQGGKRGPHHLLHFPEIQPGMENPHLNLFTQQLDVTGNGSSVERPHTPC